MSQPVGVKSMALNKYSKYICLPLDVESAQEALMIVDELKDYVGCFKIGMQLFTAEGPSLVKSVISRGSKVFLDLKYHDIPNTVGNAVKEAAKLGVSYITIHLSGGSEMIKAATDAIKEFPEDSRPMILGVTVLTSISEGQLNNELAVSRNIVEHVSSLITLGINTGVKGIVCSPSDLMQLSGRFSNVCFVTPGIRPSWSEKNDQKRIATPAQAIANGATLLVIGRPILNAENRIEAAMKVLVEIETCLKKQ
jgi:orotidine-5'-phosphate decarboxylase